MNIMLRKKDTVTMVAPLGLRFRDESTGEFIGDGLRVEVFEPGKPTQKVQAIANPSGVYVVHHAPGLISVEHGAGDAKFWSNLPPKRNFVVAVTDAEWRFQPFQINVQLPERGVFNWVSPFGMSPPDMAPSIPLYSSPVRKVPAGMAALRADLWDASNNLPAAWAVVEASIDGQLVARGVADDQGRLAIIFPQPAPRRFTASSPLSIGSPPGATGTPLTEQTWLVDLRARYELMDPLPFFPGELAPEQALPDLRSILSQREATLWADSELTMPLDTMSLRYGRELILKSRPPLSMSPSARLSVLFLTSAVSPP
jgi:hypothetical protein